MRFWSGDRGRGGSGAGEGTRVAYAPANLHRRRGAGPRSRLHPVSPRPKLQRRACILPPSSLHLQRTIGNQATLQLLRRARPG